MADPFITPTILGTACLINLIAGPIGNRADWAIVAGAKKVAGILRQGTPPQNHYLMRATQAAYVSAMRSMAVICEEIALGADELAAAKTLRTLSRSRTFSAFRFDGEHFPLTETNSEIGRMFVNGIGSLGGGGLPEAHRAYNRAVIGDLAAWGVVLPPGLERLFVDGVGQHPPWHLLLRIAFGEQIVRDKEAQAIFTVERLGEIRALGIAVIDQVAALQGEMRQGFAESAARDARLEGKVEEILVRLSEHEQNAPIALLRSLAEAFGEAKPNSDLAELESFLRDKSQEYHALRERIESIEHEDNHDAALLADATLAIDQGNFQRADQLLAQAEDLLDERIDRLQIRKAERRGLRGDAARLMGDYETAIAHYDAAVEMAPANEGEFRSVLSFSAAFAAQEWGEAADTAALAESIRRWRALAGSIDPHRYDEFWAAIQNNLGVALRMMGERERGASLLDEARTAFRAALEVRTRERYPIEWAETQNNLGAALRVLGERNGGIWVLTESVAAYRAALEVFDRGQCPSEWARTLNNLGGALRVLGELTRSSAALTEAAATFRLALEVRTLEKAPLDWAMTQNNIGTALGALGELQGDTALLREAAEAFRLAMEVCTRDRLPVLWARGQRNLGKALCSLGEREQGMQALNEADAAFVAALEVYSRDRFPLDWAMTRASHGVALLAMSRKTRSYNGARRAVAAFEDALAVFSNANAPFYLASTENYLAKARAERDRLRGTM